MVQILKKARSISYSYPGNFVSLLRRLFRHHRHHHHRRRRRHRGRLHPLRL